MKNELLFTDLPTPNGRQMEWYSRGLTAFIHFGMNTFTDREWGDGTESPTLFDPTELDCKQWVKTLKEAGFGSAILTAKHHDGFCLWPSKYTEHCVKNSPFRNGTGDVVREFTDACREYGIKAGIYLSPWDRHEKTWGSPEYNDYYVNQLTELLTNYGKIWEVWWDGAGSTEAVYDWDRWADTVRTLQPDAVIFGSLGAAPHVDIRWVGNEKGFAGKPCWGTINSSSIYTEIRDELNSGRIDGERFTPAEVDVSIRRGWFYHEWQDREVRSPENLLYLWSSSIGRNAGLLLNIPPDKRGLFHENDVEALLNFKKALDENLSENRTAGATATATSEYSDEHPAGNLLTDSDSFYAPRKDDACPAITLKLDGKKTFNTVMLREKIEHGHRIVSYEFYAKTDGEWKLLFANQCMGYTCVEHFDEITADEVKLVVKGSRGIPLVKEIGLYSFCGHIAPRQPIEAGRDLLKNARVTLSEEENSLDINLGGVYPFNSISFGTEEKISAELLIFNGTRFDSFATIEADGGYTLLSKDIDYAYKLKLIFKDIKATEVKLGLTYEERK